MLGFGPISSSPISALPDYLLNALSVTFEASVNFEAVPQSPYVQFLNQSVVRIAYTMELDIRAVR